MAAWGKKYGHAPIKRQANKAAQKGGPTKAAIAKARVADLKEWCKEKGLRVR